MRKPSTGLQRAAVIGAGRDSDQWAFPVGSSAVSTPPRHAATNSPRGDHAAPVYEPSRRLDPSLATTHAPLPSVTSSLPPPGSGPERRARPGLAEAEHVAHRPPHAAARRAAGDPGCGGHDRERDDDHRAAQPPARPAHRDALGVRAPHDPPGPLARRGILAGRQPRQRVAQLALGHAAGPSSASPSASSPRRRRELTVPRGRSSAAAISPGVSSST